MVDDLSRRQKVAREVLFDRRGAWVEATSKAYALAAWGGGDALSSDELPRTLDPSSEELREVQAASQSNWGRLLTRLVSQSLEVVSHSVPEEGTRESNTFREVWRRSRMRARQRALYQGALSSNLSYALTLPGKAAHTGALTALIRVASATRMVAFYEDSANDEFASVALHRHEVVRDGVTVAQWRVFDDKYVFLFEEGDGGEAEFVKAEAHDVGVVPVHRFSPELDVDGLSRGDIEPLLPVLRRLNQGTYNEQAAQRYTVWPIKWVAGILKPKGATNRQAARLLNQLEVLISESTDTKFGVLPGSNLEPFLRSYGDTLQYLGALAQVPPHLFVGNIANLSADAIAAMSSSYASKVRSYQASFGQTWDGVMRSCAFILATQYPDRPEFLREAQDYSTEIVWRDFETRSLAQTADALLKIHNLGVPAEMLWPFLNLWRTGMTEQAKSILEEVKADEESLARFIESIAGGAIVLNDGSNTQNMSSGEGAEVDAYHGG